MNPFSTFLDENLGQCKWFVPENLTIARNKNQKNDFELFFSHGIGIKTTNEYVDILNKILIDKNKSIFISTLSPSPIEKIHNPF